MAAFQIKAKDMIMGRADVLFRFLQLIGKDRPRDLDPYLENLDQDTESRPLVDQIVDTIISGDETLYEKYAQARREVGSRNPYSSADESTERGDYTQAFGFFMTRWIKLETTMRTILQRDRKTKREYMMPTVGALKAFVPQKWLGEIDYIRRLRNEVVHGIEIPDPEQLIAAGQFIDKILEEIDQKKTETGKGE